MCDSTAQLDRLARIFVNGLPVELPLPATVATLVALRKPAPPFAVERNKQLIRHDRYAETPLRDGDHVEIVTLVGGG